MKDPHVHVEKTPLVGFGNAEMRDLILKGTGLACDMPKTVGTGCGKRRPFAMISKVPEHVTCLPCREYARRELIQSAESAEMLLECYDKDPLMVRAAEQARVTPETLAQQASEDRATAARYA